MLYRYYRLNDVKIEVYENKIIIDKEEILFENLASIDIKIMKYEVANVNEMKYTKIRNSTSEELYIIFKYKSAKEDSKMVGHLNKKKIIKLKDYIKEKISIDNNAK